MKNLDNITIKDFMYMTLLLDTYKDNENKLHLELIKYIYGTTDIFKTESDKTIVRVIEILKGVPDFIQRFTHNGIEYGSIPNLDEITTGEFIDLDEYIKDGKELHKIASVLYRPIIKKIGNMYQIEPYEGTAKYSDIMNEVSYQIGMGAVVFFWNLSTSLSNLMDTYTLDQLKKKVKKIN